MIMKSLSVPLHLYSNLLCEIPEGLELASVELDMDVAAGSEKYSLCFYIPKTFPLSQPYIQ